MKRNKPEQTTRPEDSVEITGFTTVVSGGRKKSLTKNSRSQDTRAMTVMLKYLPTGEEGTVEIPPGHYTKKEMQRLREATRAVFLQQIGRSG